MGGLGGFWTHIFPIMKSPNTHWKQAMNFFFSLSINENLRRIFVFDTHPASALKQRLIITYCTPIPRQCTVHLSPASVHLSPAKEGHWSEEL
jgi:hypothetical protein